MNRFLLSVAAVGLCLALVGPASAGGPGGHHNSKSSHGSGSWSSHGSSSYHKSYTNYHLDYGTKFKGGYFYKGKEHSHWSYHCYDKRYGCECYYCPCTCCYYYWCQPDDCYYPVSYCPHGKYCW